MTRKASLTAVVISAACFATLGPLQTWAFAKGADSLSLLAVRFALAAVVMAAAQAMRDPSALRVGRGDLLRFVVLEGVGRPTRLEGPDPALLAAAYAEISREDAGPVAL